MNVYFDNNFNITKIENETIVKGSENFNKLCVFVPESVARINASENYSLFTATYSVRRADGCSLGPFSMDGENSLNSYIDMTNHAGYIAKSCKLSNMALRVAGSLEITIKFIRKKYSTDLTEVVNSPVITINVVKAINNESDIVVIGGTTDPTELFGEITSRVTSITNSLGGKADLTNNQQEIVADKVSVNTIRSINDKTQVIQGGTFNSDGTFTNNDNSIGLQGSVIQLNNDTQIDGDLDVDGTASIDSLECADIDATTDDGEGQIDADFINVYEEIKTDVIRARTSSDVIDIPSIVEAKALSYLNDDGTTYTNVKTMIETINGLLNTLAGNDNASSLVTQFATLKQQWDTFYSGTSSDNVINTLSEIQSELISLNNIVNGTTGTSPLNTRISNLENTIGDSTSGLVKSVNDNSTTISSKQNATISSITIGDNSYTIVTNILNALAESFNTLSQEVGGLSGADTSFTQTILGIQNNITSLVDNFNYNLGSYDTYTNNSDGTATITRKTKTIILDIENNGIKYNSDNNFFYASKNITNVSTDIKSNLPVKSFYSLTNYTDVYGISIYYYSSSEKYEVRFRINNVTSMDLLKSYLINNDIVIQFLLPESQWKNENAINGVPYSNQLTYENVKNMLKTDDDVTITGTTYLENIDVLSDSIIVSTSVEDVTITSVSANLFEMDEYIKGEFSNTTGVVTQSNAWNAYYCSKNYLPVIGGRKIYMTYYNLGSYTGTGSFIYFYDANKNYISCSGDDVNGTDVPTNAKYMKFRLYLRYIDDDSYKFLLTYSHDVFLDARWGRAFVEHEVEKIKVTSSMLSKGNTVLKIFPYGTLYLDKNASVNLNLPISLKEQVEINKKRDFKQQEQIDELYNNMNLESENSNKIVSGTAYALPTPSVSKGYCTLNKLGGVSKVNLVNNSISSWDTTTDSDYAFLKIPSGNKYATIINGNTSTSITGYNIGVCRTTNVISDGYSWFLSDSGTIVNEKVNVSDYNYIFIYPKNETVLNALLSRFKITISTNDYEYNLPYGLSSNFAQTIKSVGKNVFNKNDINNGYYLNATGGLNAGSGYFVSGYILVKPNTTYYRSGGNGYNTLAYYDINKNFVDMQYNGQFSGVGQFTTLSNACYIRLNDETSNLDNIMISLSSDTTYSEYKEVAQTIENVQINLFNYNSAKKGGYYYYSNGSWSISNDYMASDYIKVNANETYIINALCHCCYYDSNKNYVSGAILNNGVAFTIPSGISYAIISPSTTGNTVMLNRGTTALPYIPYNSLEWLGWSVNDTTRNYIDFKRKKAVIKCACVDLGTLSWTYQSDGSLWYSSNIANLIKKPANTNVISNILSAKYNNISSISLVDNNVDGIAIYTSGNILVSNSSSTETPTGKLVYELATPVEIDLANLQECLIQLDDNGTLIFENTNGVDMYYELAFPQNVKTIADICYNQILELKDKTKDDKHLYIHHVDFTINSENIDLSDVYITIMNNSNNQILSKQEFIDNIDNIIDVTAMLEDTDGNYKLDYIYINSNDIMGMAYSTSNSTRSYDLHNIDNFNDKVKKIY